MESLLRWSIENSSPATDADRVPPRPLKELDPGIIDMILGKPDAVLMRVSSCFIISIMRIIYPTVGSFSCWLGRDQRCREPRYSFG